VIGVLQVDAHSDAVLSWIGDHGARSNAIGGGRLAVQFWFLLRF
jgi:hypothetical protein